MRTSCMRWIVPLALLVACGSSEATSSGSSSLSGPIDVRLANDFDADESPPAVTVTQLVLTISRIDAKIDTGKTGDDDRWTTLSMSTTTFDLRAIALGGFTSLGSAQLPAGGVDRLRLFVRPSGSNYVVTSDGQRHNLVVPSGATEVVGDFDVQGCATGHVTLAFAGRKSVIVHPLGNGGNEWQLRPVVQVGEAAVNSTGCEASKES